MAKPEQTEKPTPKRLSEARHRGQVAKSQDVSGALIFLIGILILHFFFLPAMNAMASMMQVAFQNSHSEPLNAHSVWGVFWRAGMSLAFVLVIFFATTVVVAIAANIAQFGLLFTTYPLKPNFSKLNPFGGVKNVFASTQTLVNLIKQLIKVTAVFILVYMTLLGNAAQIYTIAQMSLHDLLGLMDSLLYTLGLRFGMLLLILGLLDYAYAQWKLNDSLKMSKWEVKDEAKASEGSQEAKQAVKKRQREFHRKRMMAAVPKATVVVTNPTHFAVALQWDELTMEAPVLTAKGADLMARRIREVAKEHGVPIMENPPLARTLYERVELDTPIPPTMYAAVAQVIAFVYRLQNRTIA
ncbi:MAG TPA: flagellar biosynthesis protein FlhB [Candidatus Binatia bacterium]|nr:flagellar biosynthesis protein FlhB [Candidatus Binatia bacterium]